MITGFDGLSVWGEASRLCTKDASQPDGPYIVAGTIFKDGNGGTYPWSEGDQTKCRHCIIFSWPWAMMVQLGLPDNWVQAEYPTFGTNYTMIQKIPDWVLPYKSLPIISAGFTGSDAGLTAIGTVTDSGNYNVMFQQWNKSPGVVPPMGVGANAWLVKGCETSGTTGAQFRSGSKTLRALNSVNNQYEERGLLAPYCDRLLLIGSWTGAEGLWAERYGNVVALHGYNVQGGAGGTIATLPAGWRPYRPQRGVVVNRNAVLSRYIIPTDGTINLYNGQSGSSACFNCVFYTTDPSVTDTSARETEINLSVNGTNKKLLTSNNDQLNKTQIYTNGGGTFGSTDKTKGGAAKTNGRLVIYDSAMITLAGGSPVDSSAFTEGTMAMKGGSYQTKDGNTPAMNGGGLTYLYHDCTNGVDEINHITLYSDRIMRLSGSDRPNQSTDNGFCACWFAQDL